MSGRHPDLEALARLADVAPEALAATAEGRHVAGCPACAAVLAELRGLGAEAGAAALPPPPDDTFARVLARRAAGERVILPVADPAPPRGLSRAARLGMAAVAAAAVLALVLRPAPELVADESSLAFLPAEPRPGDTVEVVYRPSALLAGEDSLVLRGEVHRTGETGFPRPADVARLAVLRRDGEGFRGRLVIDARWTVAALAVEDAAAARIDADRGAGWPLLAHAADGRPLLAGLRAAAEAERERSLTTALARARTATELYPDSADAWALRAALESQAGVAEVGAAEALRRLATRAGTAPEPDELAALMRLAAASGDTAAEAVFRDRLLSRAPRHPRAVQVRWYDAYTAGRDRPAARLAALERIWREAPDAFPRQALLGLRAAVTTGDAASVRRWAGRLRATGASELILAAEIGDAPALRAAAADALRRAIRGDAPLPRDLAETAEEHRARARAQRGIALARLGEFLLAEGRTAEAADTLDRAARDRWDAGTHRAAARAWLALGETERALPILARAAVDPAMPPAAADSARSLGARLAPGTWEARLRDARREMRDATLRDAIGRPLRGALRLRGPDGAATDLRRVQGGRLAVVLLVPHFYGADFLAPEVAALRDRLRADGVPVLAVRTDPSLAVPAGPRAEVWDDVSGDAARAFSNRGYPGTYVLDARGRIRFAHGALGDVPRQVAALREE